MQPTLVLANNLLIGASIVVMIFGLIFVAVFFRYIGLWIQCKMTRAAISFPNLVMMSIRKVNPTIMVRSKIMAVQAAAVVPLFQYNPPMITAPEPPAKIAAVIAKNNAIF